MSGQIGYYNDRWGQFTYANLYSLERCTFILQALLGTALVQPRICDLGCGSGWLTAILSAFGPAVGVELSPQAVELAKKKYPEAAFVAADATKWEPKPGSFEVVVSQEVIEHIEDKAAYLAVARKALSPGGYLLMTTPNRRVLEAIPMDERKKYWEIQPLELPLYRSELKKLLTNSGFEILTTSSVVDARGRLGIHRIANSPKLRGLLGAVGMRDWWKRNLLKRDFGMYMTTVARAR